MEILGIGVDIENIAAFKDKAYEKNQKFYRRIFSEREIKYCLGKEDRYPSFTGKFCAKEAVAKAQQENNMFSLSKTEIINNGTGQPEAFTNGKKLNCFLSITHNNDYAAAFCIIYK